LLLFFCGGLFLGVDGFRFHVGRLFGQQLVFLVCGCDDVVVVGEHFFRVLLFVREISKFNQFSFAVAGGLSAHVVAAFGA
jgi:hypothetical protein